MSATIWQNICQSPKDKPLLISQYTCRSVDRSRLMLDGSSRWPRRMYNCEVAFEGMTSIPLSIQSLLCGSWLIVVLYDNEQLVQNRFRRCELRVLNTCLFKQENVLVQRRSTVDLCICIEQAIGNTPTQQQVHTVLLYQAKYGMIWMEYFKCLSVYWLVSWRIGVATAASIR